MVADIPIKILLVDDNENNLMSMELVLESDDYSFFKATSGREALRILLKEEEFSLILLDVKMPIMDGYETAELIYERDKLKGIPIIFITAHDYEEEAMFKGYKAGAVDFIRKPFKPEILRSKVAVFVELYKKNRLLRKQEERLQLINNDLTLSNQELEQRVLERTIELENLNKELTELNLSKDKFLSVISHDLRNPLTSLLISSNNLYTNLENIGPKEITMFAGIIHRTSNKILEQLNELVEWAKKQREKTNFNPENFQLLKGINQSFELIRPNAVQKSITIKTEIDEDIYISADPPMFRSIIQNLVTNSIKFTPHGGVINCMAKSVGSMIEICIQDHGVGMSEETKTNLLSNNTYVSETGTDKEQGSGLGLFLVKEFITQHGGAVTIDSELGKGTSFFFTMPRVETYITH
ncbi:signal transduction histidine kinase [Mucilaginibacter frigoritolerans]|uniref:histidine kinase n=1 Tax=Mucilaginibacter frigoritolerans TaxID=652788 RepID=A0A562U4D1_9SPHI|nr:hybrid sensor histidine kinase/response regulator [Mucilaginibacter frigoritolerans]TWJ00673.1 signal transduction histidine kinase [Mucilaginibacter frigoritolerans]